MLLLLNTLKVFLISAWFCNIFAVASTTAFTTASLSTLPVPPARLIEADERQELIQDIENTNFCSAAFSVREDWSPEHFSDPVQHNPQDYRYIVRVPSGVHLENLVQDARGLKRVEAFSASLISESFNPTLFFAPYVYILQVPKENIVASYYDDMWSGFSKSQSDAAPLFEKFGLQSPTELLKLSIQNKSLKKFPWNEVKVIGQMNENVVKVIGLIYFKSRDNSEDSNLLASLQRAAAALQVPLVMED